MNIIEHTPLGLIIKKEHFLTCKIDNLSLKDICKKYKCIDTGKKCGVYQLHKFLLHLKQYNVTLQEYCEKYFHLIWPKCPITNLDLNYSIKNKDFITINNYHISAIITKENCDNFKKGCQILSQNRMGKNNPMYGKSAWNKGLDISNPIIKNMADSRRGTKMSEISREKMRIARKNHPLKARHTTPHTPELKERMREHTSGLWSKGVFNKVTSIHIKVRNFLNSINLKENFREEYQVKYYSLDFAFPDNKIGIECQGTYYHIDPRFYPNGPKDNIQRRNFGRDKAKKTYLNNRNWNVIEVWETEINNGKFEEILLCKFKELNLLEE